MVRHLLNRWYVVVIAVCLCSAVTGADWDRCLIVLGATILLAIVEVPFGLWRRDSFVPRRPLPPQEDFWDE